MKTEIIDELNNIFVDIGGGITKAKFSAVETASNKQELSAFLLGSNISIVDVCKSIVMEKNNRGEKFISILQASQVEDVKLS